MTVDKLQQLEEAVRSLDKEELRILLRKVVWASLIEGLTEDEVVRNVSEKVSQYKVVKRS